MFVGDGLYVGDGGSALETLWASGRFKAIRGCDGRYVARSAMQLDKEASLFLRSFTVEVGDGVVVNRLRGGGGLLTYVKANDAALVHTFNTESGKRPKFCRHYYYYFVFLSFRS